MQTLTIEIDGMSCGHCAAAVRRALDGMEGVEVQEVSVGAATVSYDAAVTSRERIEDAIRAEGYQPRAG
jgi:copper chaperone